MTLLLLPGQPLWKLVLQYDTIRESLRIENVKRFKVAQINTGLHLLHLQWIRKGHFLSARNPIAGAAARR